MTLILVLSLTLVAWTFAGYPALVLLLARKRTPPFQPVQEPAAVTVVIAARNEADRIRSRIRNLLDSDYPDSRIDVLIVDDGSVDATPLEVESIGDDRVRLIQAPTSLGKSAALNLAMRSVRTPLTVFADARQHYDPMAVRRLAAAFVDPTVGMAAGRLVLAEGEATGLYWRLETALRRAESLLGWSHGASGAIYAIRTSLFVPLPEGLLLDDVWTPLQIAREGYHLVFVENARAIEPERNNGSSEFRRKLRTLSGNWQLIACAPWLMLPWRNPVFFAWFSHKFLRLVAPWALAIALLVSFMEVVSDGHPLVRVLFWVQLAAYAGAGLALLTPRLARRIPLAPAAGSFLLLNVAALMSLPAWFGQRHPGRFWRG
jgi:cellulose synthase/poly-beta-1,6-N-acetylglucosamine synthase-like glycosyltransferase